MRALAATALLTAVTFTAPTLAQSEDETELTTLGSSFQGGDVTLDDEGNSYDLELRPGGGRDPRGPGRDPGRDPRRGPGRGPRGPGRGGPGYPPPGGPGHGGPAYPPPRQMPVWSISVYGGYYDTTGSIQGAHRLAEMRMYGGTLVSGEPVPMVYVVVNSMGHICNIPATAPGPGVCSYVPTHYE